MLWALLGLAMAMSFLFLPALLAHKGVGSRWIWLGGGIGGLLLVVLIVTVSIILDRPSPVHPPPNSQVSSSQTEDVEFVPLEGREPFWAEPLGFFCAYGIMASVAFMIAAIFYKPRERDSTSTLINPEGSLPNA